MKKTTIIIIMKREDEPFSHVQLIGWKVIFWVGGWTEDSCGGGGGTTDDSAGGGGGIDDSVGGGGGIIDSYESTDCSDETKEIISSELTSRTHGI